MTQNHFELFNLPERFQLDLEILQENYRAIQKEIHPDRFATSSENEKVQSMIKSTQANDAYQTLKSPIKRAKYILSLYKPNEKITLPPDFLMQQMEWEEHLEDIEKNQENAYQKIYSFLQVDSIHHSYEKKLQGKYNKKQKNKDISPELNKKLIDFYSSDVQHLEKLLNVKTNWLK